MQVWYETMWAEAGPSGINETKTVDIPSKDVLVSCALTKIIQLPSSEKLGLGLIVTTGQFITAEISITSYVQNGDPHSGNWQVVHGDNITSVTFTMFVVNGYAAGTGLIMTVNN